jgi:hypothetical protein
MRFKHNLTALIGLLLIFWVLAQAVSCRRDPVYIGALDPDPTDTTGTGSGNGNSNAQPCDPDSVYFNQQILPILASNCAKSGCHDATSHQEGVILDNFSNVRNTADVKPGNAADSKLYEVLVDDDPDDRMPPPPAAALSAAQIALIANWIDQGALNLACDAGCDTTNVGFNAAILPLVQARCQGCHSGSNPSGGILLTNHAQIKTVANNGKLWGAINHAAGFRPMPYPLGSAKIPDCDIRKIQIWIARGALND